MSTSTATVSSDEVSEAWETFLKILEGAGPFTAPLCVAMGFAIRWLLKRLAAAEKRINGMVERDRQVADRRALELLETAQLMGESGRVVEDALRNHDHRLDSLMRQLQGVLRNKGPGG